jgi:hypothetical protein
MIEIFQAHLSIFMRIYIPCLMARAVTPLNWAIEAVGGKDMTRSVGRI